jgi:hypothetical protein
VDVSWEYYYDASSGALVAMAFNDFTGVKQCVAGTVPKLPDSCLTGISPEWCPNLFGADAASE